MISTDTCLDLLKFYQTTTKGIEKEKKLAEEAKRKLSSFLKSIKETESDVTNGEAYKIKKGHVHHPNKARMNQKLLMLKIPFSTLSLKSSS